jgi:hypothetical protein
VRVVVAYAELYPETRAALEADGIKAEYEFTGSSQTAYFELMARLWKEQEAFTVIEQDIVVWPGAIAVLEACSEPLCGFAYELSTGWGSWLGCTRFSKQVIAAEPGLFQAIDALPFDGTPKRYWGRLDTRLFQVLEAGGWKKHVHWPSVRHLHEAQRFVGAFHCPHGRPIPRAVLERQPWPYPCPPECDAPHQSQP